MNYLNSDGNSLIPHSDYPINVKIPGRQRSSSLTAIHEKKKIKKLNNDDSWDVKSVTEESKQQQI